MNHSDLLDLLQQPLVMDCPWPLPVMPEYTVGDYGDWSITINTPFAARGYCTGIERVKHINYVLSRNGTVWMSCAPMELESHAHHLYAMSGTVVIAGGGLGMITYNALQKEDVNYVVLLESCESIVALMQELSKDWPNRRKLDIVHTDAKTWKPTAETKVDYLYADIWPVQGDDAAMGDMQDMIANVKPTTYSWWSMEYDFLDYCVTQGVDLPIRAEHYTDWRWDTGFELPEFGEQYAQFAEYSVRNQIMS